jgi:hypothetical protein
MEPIVNRVAQSEIIVYNLETLWDGRSVVEFDLEPYLIHGLVLREKDFRQSMKTHDWTQYQDQHVALYCSTDAIIPTWAFMLVASKLQPHAASIAYGRDTDLVRDHFVRAVAETDWAAYKDRIVVVKGCGSKVVPLNAYVEAITQLQRVARKLMYGEPCSSVPLWRKPKDASRPRPNMGVQAVSKPIILP